MKKKMEEKNQKISLSISNAKFLFFVNKIDDLRLFKNFDAFYTSI